MLPRVAAEVPSSVAIRRGGQYLATLAEALLAEGILRPADWTGDLAGTIQAGFERWVEEMQAGALQHLHQLSITYSDNISRMFGSWMDEETLLDGMPGVLDRTSPAGAFALEAGHWTEVFVGRRIEELNAVQRGLGWHVLSLIDASLSATIGGATLAWGIDDVTRHWECCEYDYEGWTPEQMEEEDILTPERFHQVVPKGAVQQHYSAHAFRHALHKPLPEWMRTAVRTAQGLHQRVDPLKSRDLAHFRSDVGDMFEGEGSQIMPIGVRWSDRDPMTRIIDDYHHLIAQTGMDTGMVWLKRFWSDDLVTARKAARGLRQTVAAVVEIDRLLGLLHVPQDTPLVEVFAAEERVRARA